MYIILDEETKLKIETAKSRVDNLYRALDFEKIFFERYPNLDARNLSTHSILAHTYNPIDVYLFSEYLHQALIVSTSIGIGSPFSITEMILHVQNAVSDYLSIFKKIFVAEYNAFYPNENIVASVTLQEKLCPFRRNWTFHQTPNFTPLMFAVIRPTRQMIKDVENSAIHNTKALWQKNVENVNEQDNVTGMTALHYVFMGHIFSDTKVAPGREKLINILIAMGCDLTLKDNLGHSALYYAMCQLTFAWDYKNDNAKFIITTLLIPYVEKLSGNSNIHTTRNTLTSISNLLLAYTKDQMLALIIELDTKGKASELFNLINPHLKKPSDRKRNRAAFLQEQAPSSMPVDDTYISTALEAIASSCPMPTL